MAHDVFISYSSKDKPVGDAVCASLEAAGIRCWMAPRDIRPGAEWSEAIIDAIAGSRAMVLIFSANANASPQIKREVERAVNREVLLVPFRIEDVRPCKSLEYFISTPHWMDAYSGPLDQHLRQLVDTLRPLILGGGTTTAAGPAHGWRAEARPVSPARRAQWVGKAAGTVCLAAVAAAIWGRLLGFGAPHAAMGELPAVPDGPEVGAPPPPVTLPPPPGPDARHMPIPFPAPPGPDGRGRSDRGPRPRPDEPPGPPEWDPRAYLPPPPPAGTMLRDGPPDRPAGPHGLRLQSVVTSGRRKACLINNRVYAEGEQADGFTIEQIHDHGVVVTQGALRFELTISR